MTYLPELSYRLPCRKNEPVAEHVPPSITRRSMAKSMPGHCGQSACLRKPDVPEVIGRDLACPHELLSRINQQQNEKSKSLRDCRESSLYPGPGAPIICPAESQAGAQRQKAVLASFSVR